MAIRIPILTSFDPKGLRQANAQFAKLQGSVSSLGRNFAVAGAALGGIGVVLGKSIGQASSLAESVNAVNVSFGKSAAGILAFGKTASTTLGVSQVEFNNAAVRFSAFAERIVGKGGDASKFIREITTRASDFASVFNIEVSEALGVFQSGLAGEAEPLKRFGINLLDSEVKAYALRTEMIKQGQTMTEQQKVIARYGLLMESTSKTAGDFANTSDGLANGMRILKAQITDTQAEIGGQLLPVLAEMMPVVREMATEFGQKLSNAVKSVDWRATITAVADFTSFLITNIETITKTIGVIFALNTAFKLLNVVVGIAKTGMAIYTWAVAQAASGMTVATAATNIFATALRMIPFVGIVAGLATIGTAMIAVRDDARLASEGVKKLYEDTKAELIADPWKQALNPAKVYVGLIRDAQETKFDGHQVSINQIERAWENAKKAAERYAGSAAGQGVNTSSLAGVMAISGGKNPFEPDTKTKTDNKGGAAPARSLSPLQTLTAEATRNIRADKQALKLEGAGLSKEVAAWVTSVDKPVVAAREALNKIDRRGATAIANLTRQYNNSNAGRAAAAAAAAAADQARIEADQARQAAEEAAQRAEAERIAERERVFQSFADSVKNTFAGIKNSILSAFDLTNLGGSTNAITRNMDKLLTRLRSFATNVKSLASAGLNPALLQQVISAGPLGGARLAEALVMGGQSGLSAINAGYAEFGALSSQIAETGTQSLFGQASQQSIYNINVDGGVGSGSTIGKAIVDAIKAYERTSGAVWQGA